jgi:hypothetical protein
MTEHNRSEGRLFEPESEGSETETIKTSARNSATGLRGYVLSPTRETSTHRRVNSLPRRIPIRPKEMSHGTEFTAGGSSVLGLGARVPGKPGTVRVMQTKDGETREVDFFTSITKLNIHELEQLLKSAKVEPAHDLTSFVTGIQYQGFNRAEYVKTALTKMSPKVLLQFAIIGAVRGSNWKKIMDGNTSIPQELIGVFDRAGFVKKPKMKSDLSILRCTAALANWVVYWLLIANIDRKLPNCACPAQLQFQAAASLPMSRIVRQQHIEFCKSFSDLLPDGKFSKTIYTAAATNPIPWEDIPDEIKPSLGVSSASDGRMDQGALAELLG